MSINATILWQSIAFIAFVLFCARYVWPPLVKNVEDRQRHIKESIEEANEAKARAAQIHSECDAIVEDAKAKAEDLRKALTLQAEHDINVMYQEAKQECSNQINGARQRGLFEVNQMKDDQEREMAYAINDAVNAILKREVKMVDHHDIVLEAKSKL